LHAARETAGLSQQQLADKLGMTQAAYAWWERNPVALRPDQLQKLSAALNVSVEELMGVAASKRRGSGPVGKLRQVFEKASQLPRHQQNKVAEFVEAFVERQSKAA
jgi:transcriptional regulator with XRE-family HTH domain